MRTDPEPPVIASNSFRYSFHRGLELFMTGVEIKPFLQNLVRRKLWELREDVGLPRSVRTDQDTMPFPAASPRRFDQKHHHAAE